MNLNEIIFINVFELIQFVQHSQKRCESQCKIYNHCQCWNEFKCSSNGRTIILSESITKSIIITSDYFSESRELFLSIHLIEIISFENNIQEKIDWKWCFINDKWNHLQSTMLWIWLRNEQSETKSWWMMNILPFSFMKFYCFVFDIIDNKHHWFHCSVNYFQFNSTQRHLTSIFQYSSIIIFSFFLFFHSFGDVVEEISKENVFFISFKNLQLEKGKSHSIKLILWKLKSTSNYPIHHTHSNRFYIRFFCWFLFIHFEILQNNKMNVFF